MNAPKPGETVVLKSLPPGFGRWLPEEDQRAIKAIVGKPVLLLEYDEDGRAELEFDDPFDGIPGTRNHNSIWVGPEFIGRHRT